MTQYAKEQPIQYDIFLKAICTFFLFIGVILLDLLANRWFPTLLFLNTFYTILVIFVWGIFVYFCLQLYRSKKFDKCAKISLTKKQAK